MIVGRCSICGGNVTMPDDWMCVIPPVPTCESCGAVQRSQLPVIPMDPPRMPPQRRFWSTTTTAWC